MIVHSEHLRPAALRVAESLTRYVETHPHHYGLVLPALNVAGQLGAQLRLALGLLRRRFRGPWVERSWLGSPKVLVDARLGGRHGSLWRPVVEELLARGVPVAGVSSSASWPAGFSLAEEVPLLHLPDWPRTSWAMDSLEARGSPRLPGLGPVHAMVVRLLARQVDRLAATWVSLLQGSSVRAVVSTEPLSPWSSSLLFAAHSQGIATLYVQQGFPGVWACPCCSVAVVWSAIGRRLIHPEQWPGTRVVTARNPSVPEDDALEGMRARRRAALGVAPAETCVLFLGQRTADQSFVVTGYQETCELVRDGLAVACRQDPGLRPVLRPHYNERGGETQGVLLEGGFPLLVSSGASLAEDLAAADWVLSMHSAALEEAHLCRRPCIQVLAGGLPVRLSFECLGMSLVRTPAALAATLLGRGAPISRPTASLPTVAAIVAAEVGSGGSHA